MDADDVIEQLEDDEIIDEPVVIKKKRPQFSQEEIQKRKERARTPKNMQALEKARQVRMETARKKELERFKEQAKKLGYEPKPPEPVPIEQPPTEPPKIEPVIEQPEPVIEPPKPTPEPPKKEKPRRIPKPKKKKIVEYIDDDEEEEEYEEPPPKPITRQRQLSQRDVDEFVRNKYATMDLQQLEQRMAKQAYDYKLQKVKEEVMGNQMFGRY